MIALDDDVRRLFGEVGVDGPLAAVVVESAFGGLVWANGAARALGLASPLVALPANDEASLPMARDGIPALQQGATWLGECRLPTSDGGELFASVYACGLAREGVPLVAMQIVDLTRAHSRLTALEASERRFHALLAATFDAYYSWEVRAGQIEFSPQVNDLLLTPDHGIGWTLQEWLEITHPDDRERSLVTTETIHHGGRFEMEYRVQRGDGSYITVSERGVALLDAQGEVEYIIGTVHDVTRERETERAHREAAELYRTLFERTSNPAWQIGPDGTYLNANQAALEFMGIERDELTSLNVENHIGELWSRSRARRQDGSAEIGPLEAVAITLGDRRRYLLVSLVPCRVDAALTYFALGTDVTAMKELSERLEASEVSLQQQATALEERTTALRVLMEQREQDRAELARNVQANMEILVRPTIERLQRSLSTRPEAPHLEALKQTLNDIVQPFSANIGLQSPVVQRLTARELEILNLIQAGMTSEQIAETLFISPSTVAAHRASLRRKLGFGLKGRRLSGHLASLALLSQAEADQATAPRSTSSSVEIAAPGPPKLLP